jgi:hypothetical protein
MIRLFLVLLAAAVMVPAVAQWGPIHEAPPDGSEGTDEAEGHVVVFDADETPDRSRRPRRGGALADDGATPIGLSASIFGGYRGLGRTEGRGFDATVGHGVRLGVEPHPSVTVDAVYAGAWRSGGTSGIGTRSHYHSVLLLGGWQHHEPPGVYGLGAGLAMTWTRVAHHWVEGEGLTAWALQPGPAIHANMRWRFAPMEIRIDGMGVWRSRQPDVMLTLGIGLFRGEEPAW